MKNFFKELSVFERILLIVSPLIIITIGIVFKSSVLTILSSAIGVVGVFLLSKGRLSGQIFAIVAAVLYSIVSFYQGFYGEVIIYVVLMIPTYIWGIIEWAKHKNNDTKSVKINSISYKEWIGVCCFAILIFIGFYFLLKALNTNELIVSTISVLSSIFGAYLLARRSKYGFVSYIFNDIILIVLWSIPVFQGNLFVLAMLMNPIVNLINDTYGVVNWTKLQKKQKSDKIINMKN